MPWPLSLAALAFLAALSSSAASVGSRRQITPAIEQYIEQVNAARYAVSVIQADNATALCEQDTPPQQWDGEKYSSAVAVQLICEAAVGIVVFSNLNKAATDLDLAFAALKNLQQSRPSGLDAQQCADFDPGTLNEAGLDGEAIGSLFCSRATVSPAAPVSPSSSSTTQSGATSVAEVSSGAFTTFSETPSSLALQPPLTTSDTPTSSLQVPVSTPSPPAISSPVSSVGTVSMPSTPSPPTHESLRPNVSSSDLAITSSLVFASVTSNTSSTQRATPSEPAPVSSANLPPSMSTSGANTTSTPSFLTSNSATTSIGNDSVSSMTAPALPTSSSTLPTSSSSNPTVPTVSPSTENPTTILAAPENITSTTTYSSLIPIGGFPLSTFQTPITPAMSGSMATTASSQVIGVTSSANMSTRSSLEQHTSSSSMWLLLTTETTTSGGIPAPTLTSRASTGFLSTASSNKPVVVLSSSDGVPVGTAAVPLGNSTVAWTWTASRPNSTALSSLPLSRNMTRGSPFTTSTIPTMASGSVNNTPSTTLPSMPALSPYAVPSAMPIPAAQVTVTVYEVIWVAYVTPTALLNRLRGGDADLTMISTHVKITPDITAFGTLGIDSPAAEQTTRTVSGLAAVPPSSRAAHVEITGTVATLSSCDC
ncbi:hypothetical protein LTR53_005557 [Teratosphaeriaceae sp. CCFEE 6253]|nr:hypothetical protein LTR53_005557 [Teratosphaeriaceae sp. CCFEE 6253]